MMFFAKLDILGCKLELRFEKCNEYDSIRDALKTSDIVVRIDYLNNWTLNTFWNLCSEIKNNISTYARTCALKVENVSVDKYHADTRATKEVDFDAYFIINEHQQTKLYLYDQETSTTFRTERFELANVR